MSEKQHLLYDDAIAELERFGITGAQIYLIDLIPLIEMIWADGKAQDAEVSILADYLKAHVKHINQQADYKALSMAEAKKFVKKLKANLMVMLYWFWVKSDLIMPPTLWNRYRKGRVNEYP